MINIICFKISAEEVKHVVTFLRWLIYWSVPRQFVIDNDAKVFCI